MPKIEIVGSKELSGDIMVSGAKNSVVAIIPAAILCDEEVKIENVPNISDVANLEVILKYLGVSVERNSDKLVINSSELVNESIPCELSAKLRASYYFMGALLGKFKKVDMCFPGGCSIGQRPINFHLKGFEKLGARIIEDDGHFIIEASELIGNEIFLDIPSVGATINILLAAVRAKGKTVIENAAIEPEIVDVCDFLNNMGANISGVGTSKLEIEGVDYLHSCYHKVIPDRIEAGTYVIIASLLGKDLKVCNIIPSHIDSLLSKLKEAGVKFDVGKDYVRVDKVLEYSAIDVTTMVYPGFPTDLQQPLVPFMVSCSGNSHIEETIFENRFLNIEDTVKMGASIEINDRVVTIYGKNHLKGQMVKATDLRGGASMIICGLIADGVTIIDNIHYILRGYDDIIGKLSKVGADIKLISSVSSD